MEILYLNDGEVDIVWKGWSNVGGGEGDVFMGMKGV